MKNEDLIYLLKKIIDEVKIVKIDYLAKKVKKTVEKKDIIL